MFLFWSVVHKNFSFGLLPTDAHNDLGVRESKMSISQTMLLFKRDAGNTLLNTQSKTEKVMTVREAILRKNLFLFGFFQKGEGGMSETKLFEELFVLFICWRFSGRGGGLPNSKLFKELFCLILDICQEGGVLPNSKTFEELLFRRGAVYLIPKMRRNFFCFGLDIFEYNLGGWPKSKHFEEL